MPHSLLEHRRHYEARPAAAERQPRHDQINDAATIYLFGTPTLKVLSFNGFLPTPGDQFKVLTWQQGLSGNFAPLSVAPYFTTNGISFTTLVTNPTGAGDLTLVAVAVPELGAGLLMLTVGALGVAYRCVAAGIATSATASARR